MKIIDKIKQVFKNDNNTISMSTINDWFYGGNNAEYGSDLSEITYFTCLKTLAESLGKMPVYLMTADKKRVKKHETNSILGVQPNSIYTPIQFFSVMEYNRNHFGNAYAYIERKGSKLVGLHILDPQMVQIWVNNTGEFTSRRYYYYYTDNKSAKSYWIDPEDMIHVKSWITDKSGTAGKSVREILSSNMAGSKSSQKFLNELYQKGLTANAVVKYVGDLSRDSQNKLLKSIESQARDDSRKMITLPVGYDIQTLDLKLTDSQFFELKKYNALQIAAAFGVKPDNINDYSKSSYSSSSMQALSFYINTLLYNITLYEQELNRKLLTTSEQEKGLGFKFNVWTILRGDPSQQADIMTKMISSAIYSPNEARAKLDMEPCENGDVHMVNGSYVRLQDIGAAYLLNQTGKEVSTDDTDNESGGSSRDIHQRRYR